MAVNLINTLQKSFTDKDYQDISQHVGISPESTKNGLKAIIPTVLVSILGNNTTNNSTQPIWWKALDEEYPYSEEEFVVTKHIHNSTFLVKGREVLSGMFRSNYDQLVTSVSSVSGVQKEKAAGLIEVGVPLIVGHLKNWMRSKGWNFKDLIENLIENKAIITAAIPVGISPTHFGVGNTPKNNFSETLKTEIPIKEKPTKKKNNGLMWFGGLVLLALILWYLMGNKSCTRSMNTDDTLVPDMTKVTKQTQMYKKSMDGTYYAYEIMPELMLKIE
jgi:hypothetical protein